MPVHISYDESSNSTRFTGNFPDGFYCSAPGVGLQSRSEEAFLGTVARRSHRWSRRAREEFPESCLLIAASDKHNHTHSQLLVRNKPLI